MDQRQRERIERVAASATDSRALRSTVLAALERVLKFHAYVWPLTDPETEVGTSPLATVPPALRSRLPDLIRLKYATTVNRWTGLSGARRLDDPAASLLWRELLRELGVTDVASSVFRDPYGCWGFLDLWRVGGVFEPAELSFLDSLTASLTTALRRVQALTFNPARTPRAPGPVVLLLDPELRVTGQTPTTAGYLAQLLPPGEGMAPVPAAAYNVAAQLLANESGVDPHPPWSRVHLADGRWLTLRAARLGDQGGIAVTIEEAAPGERAAIFARAYGLSPREQELFQQLLTGADTRTIAGRLFVSEHTVQDHLKSIFAKTGDRNRRGLLARALGTSA